MGERARDKELESHNRSTEKVNIFSLIKNGNISINTNLCLFLSHNTKSVLLFYICNFRRSLKLATPMRNWSGIEYFMS
jgi:hypothetical protein